MEVMQDKSTSLFQGMSKRISYKKLQACMAFYLSADVWMHLFGPPLERCFDVVLARMRIYTQNVVMVWWRRKVGDHMERISVAVIHYVLPKTA